MDAQQTHPTERSAEPGDLTRLGEIHQTWMDMTDSIDVSSSCITALNNVLLPQRGSYITAPTSCHLNVVVQSPPQWG